MVVRDLPNNVDNRMSKRMKTRRPSIACRENCECNIPCIRFVRHGNVRSNRQLIFDEIQNGDMSEDSGNELLHEIWLL